jgi:hypothetical protein
MKDELLKAAKKALHTLDYVCFESEEMNHDETVREAIHALHRAIAKEKTT